MTTVLGPADAWAGSDLAVLRGADCAAHARDEANRMPSAATGNARSGVRLGRLEGWIATLPTGYHPENTDAERSERQLSLGYQTYVGCSTIGGVFDATGARDVAWNQRFACVHLPSALRMRPAGAFGRFTCSGGDRVCGGRDALRRLALNLGCVSHWRGCLSGPMVPAQCHEGPTDQCPNTRRSSVSWRRTSPPKKVANPSFR